MLYRVMGKEFDDYRAFFSYTTETEDLICKHFGLHANFFSERANIKTCTYRYAKDTGSNVILRGTASLISGQRPQLTKTCKDYYSDNDLVTSTLVNTRSFMTIELPLPRQS